MEQEFLISNEVPTKDEMQRLVESFSSDDPRSWQYKRVCLRPTIQWKNLLLNLVVPILIDVLLLIYLQRYETTVVRLIPLILLLLYAVIRLKAFTLFLIKVYQRYAPLSVREQCRFKPSCSEYMKVSIEKHGVLSGVKKGLHRLKRCHADDGGFDNP